MSDWTRIALVLLPWAAGCLVTDTVRVVDGGRPGDGFDGSFFGFDQFGGFDGGPFDGPPFGGADGGGFRPCANSAECPAGSVCSGAGPGVEGACQRAVCFSNQECALGEVCSIINVCTPVPCTREADCASGKVCVEGGCFDPAPGSVVARCQVIVEPPVLVPGQRGLVTVAWLDAAGRLVPTRDGFLSAAPGLEVEGSRVHADAAIDSAISFAVQSSTVTCSAAVHVVAEAAVGEVVVIVVDAEHGRPIVGADVVLHAAQGPIALTTGANGATTIRTIPPDLGWITASAPGREGVAVLSAPRTLTVALPAGPNLATSGGSRGFVSGPQPRGHLRQAMVGYPLAHDPFAMAAGWAGWTCGATESALDVPQLALQGPAVIPDGYVASVDVARFGGDRDRCFSSLAVSEEDLGCWMASAPHEGPSARWALASSAGLVDAAAFAGILSEQAENPDRCGAGNAVLTGPYWGTHTGAVEPWATVGSIPKRAISGGGDCADRTRADHESACQPDYAAYPRADVAVRLLGDQVSLVTPPPVPELPGGGACPRLMVWRGLTLPGRGTVPLGLTQAVLAGLDCAVRPVPQILDHRIPLLPAGAVALRATARPVGSDTGVESAYAVARSVGHTSLLAQPWDRGAESQVLAGSFLAAPTAAITGGVLALTDAGDAQLVRTRWVAAGVAWNIDVPAPTRNVELPALAVPPPGTSLRITAVRARTYEGLQSQGGLRQVMLGTEPLAIATREP